MEESEYEVESIQEARVEKKRGKKLVWSYRVRWKGYKAEDDTWEPPVSFEDSEHFIERFWERANTNGRDYRDLNLFQAGEEFLPVGPPRRKVKRKQSNTAVAVKELAAKAETLNNANVITMPESGHRQLSADDSESRPTKRLREEPLGVLSTPLLAKSIPLPKSHLGPKLSSSKTIEIEEATPSPRKRTKHILTPEVIPDSDDDDASPVMINTESCLPAPRKEASNASLDGVTFASAYKEPNERLEVFTSKESASSMPLHHARTQKPLVRQLDDPNLSSLQGAISAKARALKTGKVKPVIPQAILRQPRATGSQKAKPGPGRSSAGLLRNKSTSSLLTFEKGTLKTVKGKYIHSNQLQQGETENTRMSGIGKDDARHPQDETSMVIDTTADLAAYVDESSQPTAEELLRLAGIDVRETEALPDFEDELEQIPQEQQEFKDNRDHSMTDEAQPFPTASLPDEGVHSTDQEHVDAEEMLSERTIDVKSPTLSVSASLQNALDLAKEKLFPSNLSDKVSETISASWKRPTIFGPLGLGLETPNAPMEGQKKSHSSPFLLTLDTSVSVPLQLVDQSTSSGPSLDLIISNQGPPGKFYSPECAESLLKTIRKGGPFATVVLGQNISKEDQEHFRRFSSRLHSGDLFVGMAGVEILAFCSSQNSTITHALDLPPTPTSVLVTRVVVEDYSAFADAAGKADETRWSHYILNHSES